jgi:hypothetical protein
MTIMKARSPQECVSADSFVPRHRTNSNFSTACYAFPDAESRLPRYQAVLGAGLAKRIPHRPSQNYPSQRGIERTVPGGDPGVMKERRPEAVTFLDQWPVHFAIALKQHLTIGDGDADLCGTIIGIDPVRAGRPAAFSLWMSGVRDRIRILLRTMALSIAFMTMSCASRVHFSPGNSWQTTA